MDGLLIGDVAQQTGLQPSALRYYERIGLVPSPQRQSGRRRYDPSIVHLVRVILLAKQVGFSMAEIHTLIHDFSPDTPPSVRWQAMAHIKLADVAAQIAGLRRMEQLLQQGLGCGCLRLEECVIVLNDAPETQKPLCTSGACQSESQ